MTDVEHISKAELIKLCAVDNVLFGRTFFPKTVRMATPRGHLEIDEALDNPRYRLLNIKGFRGSAKTSKARIFTAKRIAYGISRTILYVGASETHAVRSLAWLRARLEEKMGADGVSRRDFFAETFDLSLTKWGDTELKIKHGIDGHDIWVLGVGITGNVRGINFDDYRPDLIVLDDVITDENAASEPQRAKIADLIMSALKDSLTPATEEPNAKLVMLNTPQHGEDACSLAEKDIQFHTVSFPCWTKETLDKEVDEQVSSWEERFPTETLRADKKGAIARNKLSLFTREMEVRLVARETAAFRTEWLKYYEEGETPRFGSTVLGIDPVPPPNEKQMQTKQLPTDYEAHTVWRRKGDKYYLIEYDEHRGHDPSWTLATFWRLVIQHRVNLCSVEGNLYQKVLKWIFEQDMKRRGHWIPVISPTHTTNKFVRITTVLVKPAQNGQIFVRKEMSRFIQMFNDYPSVDHNDLLDSASMGIAALTNAYIDANETGDVDNSNILPMKMRRGCP